MYFDDDLVGEKPSCLYTPVTFEKIWPELNHNDENEDTYRVIFQTSSSIGFEDEATAGGWGSKNFSLDAIRRIRILGFFAVVDGFYSGYLDLTGRHLPRFQQMDAIWKPYIIDFDNLTAHASKQKQSLIKDLDSSDCTLEDDDDAWITFRNKWKIPPNFKYSELASHTYISRTNVEKFQEPRIQRTGILELPLELLDLTFRHATVNQARLLSATCRKLNIIGRVFAFRSRTITFCLPEEKWKKWLSAETDYKEVMSQLAHEEREKVIASSNFLISRPDLMEKIKALAISDNWNQALSMPGMPHKDLLSHLDNGRFHAPIFKNVLCILESSHNLTTVIIDHIELSLRMVKRICTLPRLRTLDIYACKLSDTAEMALLDDDDGLLTSANIQTLRIMSPTEGLQNAWNTVLMCPQLRSLSVRADHKTLFVPPAEDTHSKFQFFQTLESLYLGQIHPIAIPYVYDWFDTIMSYASPFKLTRFKIHNFFGLSDELAMQILRPLAGAPLQVLSMDGLKQANLGLFDDIHSLFPNLKSLSLCRRSGRRTGRISLQWPAPDWQYAQRLSIFAQLKYFRWNGPHRFGIHSPSDLVSLEEGFPDKDLSENSPDSKESDISKGAKRRLDAPYICDGHWVPLLFAIYCPSLEVVSGHIKTYYVSRPPGGNVSVGVKPILETNSYDYTHWDPSERSCWPRV